MIAQCSCGSVEIVASGDPIASAVCYCDTCQEGARRLEALPNAGPVADVDRGTGYVLFRTDRVRYSRGADLLRDVELSESAATRRASASCCNSAMAMRFEDARHWVAIYRSRLQGDPPPLQFRICTKFAPDRAAIPNDVPSSDLYPPGLMMRLLTSRIAMFFPTRRRS